MYGAVKQGALSDFHYLNENKTPLRGAITECFYSTDNITAHPISFANTFAKTVLANSAQAFQKQFLGFNMCLSVIFSGVSVIIERVKMRVMLKLNFFLT